MKVMLRCRQVIDTWNNHQTTAWSFVDHDVAPPERLQEQARVDIEVGVPDGTTFAVRPATGQMEILLPGYPFSLSPSGLIVCWFKGPLPFQKRKAKKKKARKT